ncbi:MAG: glycosyltransferase, partial [Cetobacterium sp.]
HIYAAQLWTAFVSLFLPKKRYITTEHNTNNNRRGKFYFKFLDKWMYSRYNTIVSITQNVQRELKNWIGLKADYNIIKNGINLDRYMNAVPAKREDFGLKDTDLLICQVGRFNAVKTHETTLEALRLLPSNYKVVFLGEGDTKKKMEDLSKEYGINDRVKFLGYRSDVPEIIKMCDISVLTSQYEGLPIAAIEAMTLNPFIGSDVPGIKELVEGYGELFQYKNSEELAFKIENLRTNKGSYVKVKEKCYQKALEFNIENTIEEYFRSYFGDKNGI